MICVTSYVGEDVLYKGGEPPKKSRSPKKVTSNTFHTKVTGPTSNKRPDRPGHFRSGGFVRGRTGADAGDMKAGIPEGAANQEAAAGCGWHEKAVSVKKIGSKV